MPALNRKTALRSLCRVWIRLMSALILVTALHLIILVPHETSSAPDTNRADDAMEMAYFLSVLEERGSFNALYDLIHPDAHAVVPRNAVVGWYIDNFSPRGASAASITGVRFVSWTWEVTGVTYPVTAEVSFTQEFWDDGAQTVLDDVVRLVQDDDGVWRWFFGRNQDFVEEMIDLYVAPYPKETLLSSAVEDVGNFWIGVFWQAGLDYRPPEVLVYQNGVDSICGGTDVGPASYCALSTTIYVDEDWYFATVNNIGDFAWVTILAHEYGHHVQAQLSENRIAQAPEFQGITGLELGADCLAGVYAQDAQTRGLLETGDIAEAVNISILAGGGDHGSSDDRATAFMIGYLSGFYGCGLTL